jgi:hypothetical protein
VRVHRACANFLVEFGVLERSEFAMKKFFYLIIIFLVVGIWLGINLANNQPFFSDPFAGKDIGEKAAVQVEKLSKGAKDAVERTIERTLHE